MSYENLVDNSIQLVYVFLNIAGSDQRQEDLFSAEALFAKGRSALKGLKGVENVYMQHTPHLSQTLENLLRGRLRDTNFPFLDGAGPNATLQRSVQSLFVWRHADSRLL